MSPLDQAAHSPSHEERFKALVESYAPKLYRYARTLTRDHALAEDLVQETLLRAWRYLDSLRADGAAKAWLTTILHNEFVREVSRRRTFVSLDSNALDMPDPRASVGGADIDWIDIAHVIESIPPKYLEPLVLQVVMGHTTEEISQILGLTQSTVLVHLHRGRKHLRVLMGQEPPPNKRGRRSRAQPALADTGSLMTEPSIACNARTA